MKRGVRIVLFIGLMFGGSVEAYDPPPEITLRHIYFDWHGRVGAPACPAVDIRKNASTEVYRPEWLEGLRNNPAAYPKSTTVKVSPSFVASGIDSCWVRATSSDFLGNLGEQKVEFWRGIPENSDGPYYFQAANNTVSYVAKKTVTWQWKVRNINGGGSSEVTFDSSGPHTIYVLLGNPQAPMTEPWTEVLDYSCVWAAWQPGAAGAATKIAQKIYTDLGLSYDTKNGAPSYTDHGGGATFHLTSFLNDIPGSNLSFNCYDTGKAVKTFANAIGCGLSYKVSWSFGYLNCIKPAGKGWANNPFYDYGYPISSDPIVGEDDNINDGRSYFGNHAFGGLGSDIYDASLKVDHDSNPDYGPPFSESWTTGWEWDYYKSAQGVVDYVPLLGGSPPATPTSYSFGVD